MHPGVRIGRTRISLPAALSRKFTVINRPTPRYSQHVPLTWLERGSMAIGAAAISIANPRRDDLIAALGEATSVPYFIFRLRNAMLAHPTGRRILQDRPRITSESVSLDRLRKLPHTSVGSAYLQWLEREKVIPDTRSIVRYIDDEECAYVMQRYRESHDFLHAITGLPTFVEGELALKAFEFANNLLPMTGLSLFAYFRLKPAEKKRFVQTYFMWALNNGLKSEALINVYWEEKLDEDVTLLRQELGIEQPPDLRAARRRSRKASTSQI